MRIRFAAAAAAVLAAACKAPPEAPAQPAPVAQGGAAVASTNAGHSAIDGGSDATALLAELDQHAAELKDKPKSFEVLSALGNLYYEKNRYLDAVDTYRQALEKAAPADEAAQALRRRGVKPAAGLPPECRRSGQASGLDQIAAAAKKLEATRPAQALRCYDEALGMALADRSRRGNALYLLGNPDTALAEHRAVLARDPGYPESLFFVGAILLEKSRNEPALKKEGVALWEKLLQVAPDHPRAAIVKENLKRLDELFAQQPPARPLSGDEQQGDLPAGHPPVGGSAAQPPPAAEEVGPSAEQVKNVAEAMQNVEMTPELKKQLDEAVSKGEALLDQGKYADARGVLLQAMAMRPDDAQLAAALGGAMRGLGRIPMAERTLARALALDPRSPRANYEQALVQAMKGDKAGAAARLQQLKSIDAAWARRHDVDGELARLR